MLVVKKNAYEFYSEIRKVFKEIEVLTIWSEFDFKEDPSWNATILTSLAEVVIAWMTKGEVKKVEKMLDFVEAAYSDYRDDFMCYIYTDFHPTVIGAEDKQARESIKKLMGPVTMEHYNQLIDLGFYTEVD